MKKLNPLCGMLGGFISLFVTGIGYRSRRER